MAEILAHTFVSGKSDSADGTIVSSGEWNDGHSFASGVDGQLLMRDSSQGKGAKWVDGPLVQRISDAFTGNVGTTTPLSSVNVSFSSNGYILLIASLLCTLASGTAGIVSIRRNSVAISTGAFLANSTFIVPFTALAVEVAGTYTYEMIVTGSSGNITNVQTVLSLIKIGRL